MENQLVGVLRGGGWDPWSHVLKCPWEHATLCEEGARPSSAVPWPAVRAALPRTCPGWHRAPKTFPRSPWTLGALQGPEPREGSAGLVLIGALHQRSQLVKAEN